MLDALPTSRTYAAEGSLAVGVKVVAQNVGGARIAAQQRLYVHGAAAADNTVAGRWHVDEFDLFERRDPVRITTTR